MFTVRSWTFSTSSTSRKRSCVSGRRETMPCWAKAIAVASTAPIQMGRYLSPCASLSKTMGLFDGISTRSEEHTSELQSRSDLVCRLLLEKKKQKERRAHSLHLARAAARAL